MEKENLFWNAFFVTCEAYTKKVKKGIGIYFRVSHQPEPKTSKHAASKKGVVWWSLWGKGYVGCNTDLEAH